MVPILLVLIFVVSTLVGYKVISNVPSLLHTPLMSGMNALSDNDFRVTGGNGFCCGNGQQNFRGNSHYPGNK